MELLRVHLSPPLSSLVFIALAQEEKKGLPFLLVVEVVCIEWEEEEVVLGFWLVLRDGFIRVQVLPHHHLHWDRHLACIPLILPPFVLD